MQKSYIEESLSYLNTFFNTSFKFKDLNNIIYVNKNEEKLEKNMIEEKDGVVISTSESKYLIDPKLPHLLDTIIRNNNDYLCEFLTLRKKGIVFPFNLILRLKNQLVLDLKYKRILFDKPTKFLFEIPQGYASRKYLFYVFLICSKALLSQDKDKLKKQKQILEKEINFTTNLLDKTKK